MYAQPSDLSALSLTPQQAARFGETAMSASLQAASSLADVYLASQFTLPLQTDPQGWDMQLTRVVCDIAAFNLYRQFGMNPSAPDFGAVKSLYDNAMDWLKQVAVKSLSPQYVDSGGSPGDVEEGGPFVITATQRGYSERGITNNPGPFSSD